MNKLHKNAIALIQLGFEDYFLVEQDPRRIYSSIKNLYSGILVLFKAELFKRSPEGSEELMLKKKHKITLENNKIIIIGVGSKSIGLDEFKERFKLLNISIDEEIKSLKELSKLRNAIEHHYSDVQKETLENAIIESFLILNKFNSRYSQLTTDDLYDNKNWKKLVDIEIYHKNFKTECNSKWSNIDFKTISARIFPVSRKDDDIEVETIFQSIKCLKCRSDLIEPIKYDFNTSTNIDMQCIKCNACFNFIEIIEGFLEKHYEYEIMKVGSKGGCIPLSRCKSCNRGTFLNYESVCIYCGNTQEGIYDPNFDIGLFIRNASEYWDNI